jgi:hypothetical protein
VNKDLKMLLITVVAFIVVLLFVWSLEKQSCETVRYQNLSGAHSERVCEWQK